MQKLVDMDTAATHLSESFKIRRYFKKFSKIIKNFQKIALAEVDENNYEYFVIMKYLKLLENSFNSLSMKYLFSDVVNYKLPSRMIIDASDSGFPNSKLIKEMLGDLSNKKIVLSELPTEEELKEDLILHILKYKSVPRDLQFSMSQKKYYESLKNDFFKPFNMGSFELVEGYEKDRYIIDWATYDDVSNTPYVYLLELEDSAKSLKDDTNLKEQLIKVLKSESVSTLKPLFIATNIDKMFNTLHPKSLKRIKIGPVFSNAFTQHHDDITEILKDLEIDQDYIFNWSIEHIISQKQTSVKTGFLSNEKREIFMINHYDMKSVEKGVTTYLDFSIVPHEAYQKAISTEELHGVVKNSQIYTVDKNGQISHVS